MKKIVCHGDSLTEASDLDKNYTWRMDFIPISRVTG
jgi:hypothetical protein